MPPTPQNEKTATSERWGWPVSTDPALLAGNPEEVVGLLEAGEAKDGQ